LLSARQVIRDVDGMCTQVAHSGLDAANQRIANALGTQDAREGPR
jgi:hypothetical protein